jgi:hypothetical protein
MQRVYENIYLKSFFLPSKAYLTKQTWTIKDKVMCI